MKLPELTQSLLRSDSPEAFAEWLRRSWVNYGASEAEGAGFTLNLGENGVTAKTFYEAMAFLKFKGEKRNGDRLYRLARSPYTVVATPQDGSIVVRVEQGGETEVPPDEQVKEGTIAFLHVYRERLKQDAPALDLDGMDAGMLEDLSMLGNPEEVATKFDYFRAETAQNVLATAENTGIPFTVVIDPQPYTSDTATAETMQVSALYIKTENDEFIIEGAEDGRLLVSGPRGTISAEPKDSNTLYVKDAETEGPVEESEGSMAISATGGAGEVPLEGGIGPAISNWPTTALGTGGVTAQQAGMPPPPPDVDPGTWQMLVNTVGAQAAYGIMRVRPDQFTPRDWIDLMAVHYGNPYFSPEQVADQVARWARGTGDQYGDDPLMPDQINFVRQYLEWGSRQLSDPNSKLRWAPILEAIRLFVSGSSFLGLLTMGGTAIGLALLASHLAAKDLSAGTLSAYEQLINMASRILATEGGDKAVQGGRDLQAALTVLNARNDPNTDSWLLRMSNQLAAILTSLGAVNATAQSIFDPANIKFERPSGNPRSPYGEVKPAHKPVGGNKAGMTTSDLAAQAYTLATGKTLTKMSSLAGAQKTKAVAEMKAMFPNEANTAYYIPSGWWVDAGKVSWHANEARISSKSLFTAYSKTAEYKQLQQALTKTATERVGTGTSKWTAVPVEEPEKIVPKPAVPAFVPPAGFTGAQINIIAKQLGMTAANVKKMILALGIKRFSSSVVWQVRAAAIQRGIIKRR